VSDKIRQAWIPWLLICYFFCIPLSHSQEQNHKWLFKNRVQSGIDYDTNVEESRHDQFADGLLKFIWDSQAKHYNKIYLLNVQYHGGLQYYFQTPVEHKMTHDLSGSFIYLLTRQVRFGTRIWGRFKYFNGRDWHYFLKTSELFLTLNVLPFHSTIGYENEGLNYFNYNKYNFNAHHFYLLVTKRFDGYFSANLKTGYRLLNYRRLIVVLEDYSDYLKEFQKDDNPYISLQLTYRKGMLGSVDYQFQRYLSNSYGFSYRQHKLTLSLISSLKKGFLVRIFGGIQRKNYDEELDRIIVTELDTEREISNFLILDCSKEIASSLGFLIRMSWYNNESPIPGRYYQKMLTSLSFEYRF